MSVIEAAVTAVGVRLMMLGAALAALGRLIAIAIKSLSGHDGTVQQRLVAGLTSPVGQRRVFDVLRAFLPNFVIKRKFITSYDNGGTAVVTRFEDVKEVLARDGEFEVVYGPRMIEITGGQNFFLGMQDTPDYTRDVSNMRIAVRRTDLPSIVQPFAARKAADREAPPVLSRCLRPSTRHPPTRAPYLYRPGRP